MALSSIASHKLRSALTLLGVLVGVFSIVLVMTAMRALQTSIESEMTRLGSDTFQVQKWPAIQVSGPEGWEKYRRRERLTYEQAVVVKERATYARDVGVEGGLWTGRARSRYAESNPDVRLRGVSTGTFAARNWFVGEGRALLPDDIDGARMVCVLGFDAAKLLFPYGSAVGEEVKFRGLAYRVVGVLQSRGGLFGESQDNFMAVPITTGLNLFGKERNLNILVQARNAALFEETIEQVRGILRTIRKVEPGAEDDFDIVSNESLVTQFRTVTLAARLGVAFISSIALVAAGIGIMNIMLVSVTERTREIGIRRALGARRSSVLAQFLVEAIVLCQIGGVAGVLLGVAGGNGAAVLLKVTPVFPLDWAAIGLTICLLVGIVFGTYPALKAAHLDPIESLRYE